MKGFLQTALSIIAVVLVVSAIGLSIEWLRRRSLQKWAQERGGTFDPGAFLDGVELPEAKPFDLGVEKAKYHNVTRISRPEASYVVTQSQTMWKDTKSEWKSFSCVVCFITLPAPPLPTVRVSFPTRAPLLGRPAPAAPVRVADASPAFTEEFELRPLGEGGEPSAEAVARVLPKAVQDELVASRSLISGFEVRGNVVRLQAVSKQTGYPHQDVFACAERLVAAWTAKR